MCRGRILTGYGVDGVVGHVMEQGGAIGCGDVLQGDRVHVAQAQGFQLQGGFHAVGRKLDFPYDGLGSCLLYTSPSPRD